MASRLKEDERNERSIRNLMKLSENRRCINCNSLGPQYVCTSFCTFVCTTCSGIHREFTHRVKSVSMAKFSTQEVSALQGGGNASAKEIYFKEWDAQRQSFPDSSNVERLRDFIKHVYVDRRYSGERSFDKPPRAKMGEAEGSRSPPYENERNYSDRPSPGGRSDVSSRNSYDERRSPGYDQDFKKIPAQTDNIVNDWRREDRFGKKSDTGSSKIEVRSPDRQRDPDNVSSPPIVIPVRDILGDSVSPLRVIEPPRANGSLQPQRTASSSSLASSNGNPTELRRESSLIDFEADPEPPSTAAVPQTHATAPSPAPAPAPFMAPPTVSSNDNWASFDSSPVIKASQQPPPSSVNLLDMLSELSVPASRNNPVVASGQVSSFGTTAPVTSQPIYNAFGIQPPTSISNQAGGGSLNNPVVASGQVSSFGTTAPVVTPQPIYNAFGIQPPTSMFNQAGGGSLNNQAWTPSLSGNTQLPSSTPSAESQVTSGIEAKPTAKQELPADLFTSSYSPFAAQGQGWYPAPQYGMGFNMQYNVPQPMPPAFIQPSKSSNPFDLNESRAAQPTAFPSMAPLQGALPNTGPPSGMQQTPSVGDPAPIWMAHQSSHPLAMPPQGSSYGSSMPSGPFMGQVPQNMPPQSRPQVGNFGYDMSSFGFLNTNQQVYATAPSTTRNNTFSSNPFG